MKRMEKKKFLAPLLLRQLLQLRHHLHQPPKFFLLSILFLFLSSPAKAKDWLFAHPKKSCDARCVQKLERFFDRDRNGYLSWFERSLVYTCQRQGWPLANTRKKKKYDFNGDWMLEPEEWSQYQAHR